MSSLLVVDEGIGEVEVDVELLVDGAGDVLPHLLPDLRGAATSTVRGRTEVPEARSCCPPLLRFGGRCELYSDFKL